MKNTFKILLVVAILAIALIAFTGCNTTPPACEHTGGTALCNELAVCELCGESYGEYAEHYEQDVSAKAPSCEEAGLTAGKKCAICGEVLEAQEEVAALGHTWTEANCTAAKTCGTCGATEGNALGHNEVVDVAVDATCKNPGKTEGKHCETCGEVTVAQTEIAQLAHTLTFITTPPTADVPGKTIGTCSVCSEVIDFGAVNQMGVGKYVLEASALEGIVAGDYVDGEVVVIDNVFECHLSAKYKTDSSKKTFSDDYFQTLRLNWSGKTEFGTEEDPNLIKNAIVFTTTEQTTVTVWWVCAGDGRGVALYGLDGTIIESSDAGAVKDSLYITPLVVPAGTYALGTDCTNAAKGGGNYFFKVEVVVEEAVSVPEGYTGVSNADELVSALANNENVYLLDDINCDTGIVVPAGVTLDGNGHSITYAGTDYSYHLVKPDNNAHIKNVVLNNYRIRSVDTADAVITISDVTINMDNDLTGLDFSNYGTGKVVLNNVVCAGIKDATHLDPSTQVQVEYTPYGDVLIGTKWTLEATGCTFGSLHGWNTTNGSYFSLTDTTCTVLRMHYWSGRVLYIDGVETAWSESGAIPVAHDVGGCWSVMEAFK